MRGLDLRSCVDVVSGRLPLVRLTTGSRWCEQNAVRYCVLRCVSSCLAGLPIASAAVASVLFVMQRKCVLYRVEFHHAGKDHGVLLDCLGGFQRLLDDLRLLLGSCKVAGVETDVLSLVLRYEVFEVRVHHVQEVAYLFVL